MKKLLFVITLLLLPISISAKDYLEVTAPGNRQAQLAIARPIAMSGEQNDKLAQEVADIFSFDLTLAGPFQVMPISPAEGRTGIRAGEFNMATWQAAGANLLVKSGYIANTSTVTMEFRFYDVTRNKELAVKRFSGKRSDLRKIVHMFSDQDPAWLSPASPALLPAKPLFVSTATGSKEIYLDGL